MWNNEFDVWTWGFCQTPKKHVPRQEQMAAAQYRKQQEELAAAQRGPQQQDWAAALDQHQVPQETAELKQPQEQPAKKAWHMDQSSGN